VKELADRRLSYVRKFTYLYGYTVPTCSLWHRWA